MGVTCDQARETTNGVQMCSFTRVAHVVLCVVVLVGVGRVTVVHIGHEDVVVVIYFCVAIFVRDLLYQEMYSLQYHRKFINVLHWIFWRTVQQLSQSIIHSIQE